MEVSITCRCGDCIYWKKEKFLRYKGICLCQVDEEEMRIYKEETDFCNYGELKQKE